MKQFVILVCFAALCAAAPQGYKYQQQQQPSGVLPIGNLRPQTPVSSSGIYTAPGQISVQAQSIQTQPIQTIQNVIAPAPVPISVPQPIVNNVAQQIVQPQQIVQQPQQIVQQPQYVQQPQQVVQTQYVQRPAIITKDIYIHSAPDDTEEIRQADTPLDNLPIRKNYRIVFIKAPTQNLKHTAAALKRAQATNEEKTVIYVLSKKPDITEIQQQLQVTQSEAKVHKPEVYFIKYKTQEEAQRAQQEIQAQYDALGGATHISDEGVAPITTVSGGSLNLGNIGLQSQSYVQPQTQTIVQPLPVFNQQQQQQQQHNSFVQTSSSSVSGLNLGVSVPSKKYVPARTL